MKYVLGPGSPCFRPAWFEAKSPVHSILLTGNQPKRHARRKAWAPHFSPKSLDAYQSRIERNVAALETQLLRAQGQPVDASALIKRWGYDVMSDLTFGSSFEMLRTGKSHPTVSAIERGLEANGYLGHMPWLFCLLSDLLTPFVSAQTNALQRWFEAQIQARETVSLSQAAALPFPPDRSPSPTPASPRSCPSCAAPRRPRPTRARTTAGCTATWAPRCWPGRSPRRRPRPGACTTSRATRPWPPRSAPSSRRSPPPTTAAPSRPARCRIRRRSSMPSSPRPSACTRRTRPAWCARPRPRASSSAAPASPATSRCTCPSCRSSAVRFPPFPPHSPRPHPHRPAGSVLPTD